MFNEVLKPMGITKCGIRLDSGDMAYLTQQARIMLDEAGWTECSISVSNSLDEYIIRDILRQGAKIDLFGVGRTNPEDNTEKFSMSVFALNTCQEANGVSWLHGEVSKKMFSPVWPGYFPEELHVDYVTNGVHMPTWAAHEWKDIYAKYLPKEWIHDQSNMEMWKPYADIPDAEIWATRMSLKRKMMDYIKEKFREDWMKIMLCL